MRKTVNSPQAALEAILAKDKPLPAKSENFGPVEHQPRYPIPALISDLGVIRQVDVTATPVHDGILNYMGISQQLCEPQVPLKVAASQCRRPTLKAKLP